MARFRIILLAAIAVTLLGSAGDAVAKKKVKTVSVTTAVNAIVPDATGGAPGQLDSTATIGSKAKGRKIRDVNVTVQTTGSNAAAPAGLIARLSSPAGATIFLFGVLSGPNVGPLTLDDESTRLLTTGSAPTNAFVLGPPYIGTAQPGISGSAKPLAVMDGDRAKGAWTLSLFDIGGGDTNVLNAWTLEVRAGLPFKTD